MDDGRELPLIKLETTSETHPFYTGTQKSVDSLGGRVEKFRNKFAHLGMKQVSGVGASRREGSCGCLFCCPAAPARPLGHDAAVNTPTPALVTQRAARRMPRLALLLLCAAYVLPGVFARDPWRNADITAFGYMLSLAEGRSSWLAPVAGRRAGRRRAAAALAGCRLRLRCCRPGSTRPWPRALPFAPAAGAGAVAHLVQRLPAGPHRSGATGRLRLRRRGRDRWTMPAPLPTPPCWR